MGLRWGWACESTTLAEPPDEIGSGASSVTANSGAVCDTTDVKVGTNSATCPTNQDFFSAAESGIWDNSSSYINSHGGWYIFNTWTVAENFLRMDESAAPNDNIQLFLADTSGSGNISLFFRAQGVGDTTLTTTVSSLATGNFYWIQFAADRGNTKAKLSVFDTDGVQIGSTIENTSIDNTHMVTTQVDEVLFGNVGNGLDSMSMDNIMFGDDYDDDHVANRNITDMADWGADDNNFTISATALSAWAGQSTSASNFDISAAASLTFESNSFAAADLNAAATATAVFDSNAIIGAALNVDANALAVFVGEAAVDGAGDFSMTAVATVTFDGESITSAGFDIDSAATVEWVGEDAGAIIVLPNEAQREPVEGGGYGWGDALNIKRIKNKKLRLILEDDEEFMEIVKKAIPELLLAYRKNIH